MGLLKFFYGPDGRVSRSQYWFGTIVALLVALVAWELPKLTIFPEVRFLLMGVPVIALFFIWVKRLHDLGRSGWWALLLLPFPYLNLAAGLFWLGFIPGAEKENKYGTEPASRLHSKEGGVLFKMKKAG
ncbi:MAG: DUF805 domain-containing protein [Rickettsiales bacterium]|nr:DUF805 domain-containing protein [Rickettsiales bacterium]